MLVSLYLRINYEDVTILVTEDISWNQVPNGINGIGVATNSFLSIKTKGGHVDIIENWTVPYLGANSSVLLTMLPGYDRNLVPVIFQFIFVM